MELVQDAEIIAGEKNVPPDTKSWLQVLHWKQTLVSQILCHHRKSSRGYMKPMFAEKPLKNISSFNCIGSFYSIKSTLLDGVKGIFGITRGGCVKPKEIWW